VTTTTIVELTTTELAKRIGVTFRQLDYWVRSGKLQIPQDRPGSGVRRLWSPEQARRAQAFAALVRAGVTPSAVGAAMPTLLVGPYGFAVQLDGLIVTGPLP
jgi:DNA-binding transcriptional MerR regulator